MFFFFRPPLPSGEFPERKLYAFVDDVERVGDGKRGRISFLLDCIDAKQFDAHGPSFELEKPFAQIRILTTEGRMESTAGTQPKPGDWWEIHISPRIRPGTPAGLPTWHIQLADGAYLERARGVTTKLRFLGRYDEPPRKSVGAAAITNPTVTALLTSFSLKATASRKIGAILNGIAQADAVMVYDVGQASMAALIDKNAAPILIVDAGLPVSFNRKTLSRRPLNIDTRRNPPVLLTHWDWDHMCAGLEQSAFQQLTWIVPDQPIGPGKARLAKKLAAGKKLAIWSGGSKRYNFGTIIPCSGGAADPNNSGLALLAELSGGKVLMPGDAHYDQIPLPPATRPDGLVGTHHGGRFGSSCIRPSAAQNLVVFSYGAGNAYRHPRDESLNAHRRAGWDVKYTAGARGKARGSRIIRP